MVHVMIVVMVVIIMVMVMVVVMLRHGSWGGRRSGFLRQGVSGEAERERGGCDKGLDHGRSS